MNKRLFLPIIAVAVLSFGSCVAMEKREEEISRRYCSKVKKKKKKKSDPIKEYIKRQSKHLKKRILELKAEGEILRERYREQIRKKSKEWLFWDINERLAYCLSLDDE